MENSSDKQIQEKLSNTEFPFDPQAWDRMEAMLSEKKKRGVFFWWWTGGIAAALLFGVIGYELRGLIEKNEITYLMEEQNLKQVGSREETREETIGNKQTNTVATPDETGGMKQVSSSAKQEHTNELQKNIEPKSRIRKGKAEVSTSAVARGKLKIEKENQSSVLFRENPFHQRHPRANAFSKVKSKKTPLEETTSANSIQISARANPYRKEIEMLSEASSKNTTAENILLARREAELLQSISDKTETGFDKKEEEALPKKKKQIFNYSLGVLANVTGTTLGSQPGNQPERPPLFYSSPSYMVGFTHDFLFVNRIAFTNSILFSQTSFKVYHPKTIGLTQAPTDFTSHITEAAIPIGIKVYAVVKNNFRFYINAGIINHIKLKETFDYTLAPDTLLASTSTLADNSLFPTQTNFATGIESAVNKSSNGNSNSTSDFSINSAKRYYASFYASAGFEFIAKKHFVLFAEPTFYMGLQKIGVQEKRKYNLGLSGGFRYRF